MTPLTLIAMLALFVFAFCFTQWLFIQLWMDRTGRSPDFLSPDALRAKFAAPIAASKGYGIAATISITIAGIILALT